VMVLSITHLLVFGADEAPRLIESVRPDHAEMKEAMVPSRQGRLVRLPAGA
jgi:hypothetical protein